MGKGILKNSVWQEVILPAGASSFSEEMLCGLIREELMADSIMEQIEEPGYTGGARILVVGVGGGGGNAIKNMIDKGLGGVEFVCANTDLQALNANPAPVRLQLGEKLTRGLGAGSNPEVGREAANESLTMIQQALANADMVFVTAGMGGGTGTGAAPVIAECAKKSGALTVGVVTRPFTIEGKKRSAYAQAGIDELVKHVDCLITIPNDRIKTFAPKNTPLRDLLAKANDVLYDGVKGISDVITRPGLINLDFADVQTCMSESGLALMGMGRGKGENRAEDAVNSAITSPLLEDVNLGTCKAILYNITGPENMSGDEMETIGNRIGEAVPEDANIVMGVVFDDQLEDEICVTVVATGIESVPQLDARAINPAAAKGAKPAVPGAAGTTGGRPGQTVTPPVQQPVQPVPPVQPQPVIYQGGGQQPGRSSFAQSARDRWIQENGTFAHTGHEPHLGHGNFSGDINYDEEQLNIPAFIRNSAE